MKYSVIICSLVMLCDLTLILNAKEKTKIETKDFYQDQIKTETFFDLKNEADLQRAKANTSSFEKLPPSSAGQQQFFADLKASTAHVKFLATASPNSIHFEGQNNTPHPILGELILVQDSHSTTLSGRAAFNLDNLNTGIALRDERAKDVYLETKKWRYAQLRLDPITLLPPQTEESISEGKNTPFRADVIVKGVKMPVRGTLTYSLFKEPKTSVLNFEFPINMSDFAIATPRYEGMVMDNKVLIQVDVQTHLQEVNTRSLTSKFPKNAPPSSNKEHKNKEDSTPLASPSDIHE